MTRLIIIPAAGRGSRLGWDGPKALSPVAGRPMIDFVLERYSDVASRFVVVVAPAAVPAFEAYLPTTRGAIDCVVQPEPTGMLPAVLCARPAIETHQPDQVWITWCDQIGISAATIARLRQAMDDQPAAALVFPSVRQAPPYIHFVRDADGRIAGVFQRRDGDPMPSVGESDAGLFAMRREVFLNDLVEYARIAPVSDRTQERNFLPFIPWLAERAVVRTVELADPREALGVNTADDRRTMEAYLSERR
jgi:bifunctional N-acetylglucosamine-1-phosphate-uridyltransferase/glucosamine-1-phosphate-acetyltransferase GlmU-like protein